MSGPVDVLTVMDDAAATLAKVAQIQMTERADEMREAHAAVADLIAVGGYLLGAFRSLGTTKDVVAAHRLRGDCETALLAFNAALERCKGGAA